MIGALSRLTFRLPFVLRWAAVNVFAWTLCLYLLRSVSVSYNYTLRDWILFLPLTLMCLVDIGVLQSLALHRRVQLAWVVSVVLGVSLGGLLGLFALHPLDALRFTPFYNLLVGAAIGLLLGLAQWGFLRQYRRGWLMWIIANLLGSAVCAVFSLPFNWPGVLIGTALMACLTGLTLLRLAPR